MSYERGNRVFYDGASGVKLWETGEVWESTVPIPHQEITGAIGYVDLPVKSYDTTRYYIKSINLETLEPILKKYDWVLGAPTPDEVISKLEEELALVKEQQLVGGIV